MEIKIIFQVNRPEKIKYKIEPEPNFNSNGICVFEVPPNKPLDIFFSITERQGHTSNVTIKQVLYEDYEMRNLNDFCTLFKDKKTYKTHGYIDNGTYRIRIRSNPISQHFVEYLLGLTQNKS